MAILNAIEGGRSEYLAWYALSTIGFTTPVPRQSDGFLTDFLVYLFEPCDQARSRVRPTGPALLVQIKSNDDPISFENEQLETLLGLELPFYIGVISKCDRTLAVYQTRERISHRHHPLYKKLTLKMEPKPEAFENHPPVGILHIGPPIVRIEIDALDDQGSERTTFRSLMGQWAEIDLRLLGWNLGGFPLSTDVNYRTNELPDPPSRLRFQYNDKVLRPAVEEFSILCEALAAMLRTAAKSGDATFDSLQGPLAALLGKISACAAPSSSG